MDLFFFIPAQVDTMALKTSGLGQHDKRIQTCIKLTSFIWNIVLASHNDWQIITELVLLHLYLIKNTCSLSPGPLWRARASGTLYLHIPPSRHHWVDIWWILTVYLLPTLGAWPQAMESVFSFSKHWIATGFLSRVYVRCSLLIAVWNESPELFISPFVVNISPSFPGLWW